MTTCRHEGDHSMPRDLLRSQRLRMVNHQGDALRLGMNWTEEDLGKPQVPVDSAYGIGQPTTDCEDDPGAGNARGRSHDTERSHLLARESPCQEACQWSDRRVSGRPMTVLA